MAAQALIHRQPIRGWRPSEYGSRGNKRLAPQAGSEISAEASRAIEAAMKDVFDSADPETIDWLRHLTI